MAYAVASSNKAAISAISLLDKREILKNAIDVNNEEGLIDILGMGGKMKPTSMSVYHDYVEDDLHILLDTTGATVSGNGTASVTTTFTAATSGYVRKGLKVISPNGKVGQVQSFTTASSQDTAVIKSVDGTNLTHTAGQKLAPMGITVGESSSAPANLRTGFTKYFNLTEQFREVNVESDVQLSSEIELEYNGQPYIFHRNIANKFIMFKGSINASLIAGKISAATFEDATSALADPTGGGGQQTTRGLGQYVTTYGVTDSITTLGTVVLGDFADMNVLLDAARAPKDYMVLCANAVMMKYSNFLKSLNSSGVTSGRLSLDGKEIDFNAEKLIYGHRKMQFVGLPIFDHPAFFSQTDIVKSGYWVPQGKVSTKNGKLEDRMSIRYKKTQNPGLGNEIWEEWDTGALARGGATSDVRSRSTHWFTEQGLQILGARHFAKQTVNP